MHQSILKRAICLILSVCLFLQVSEAALAAYATNTDKGSVTDTGNNNLVITDENGNTTEVDETWESKYPYGAFALEKGSMTTTEGGDELVLTVFRLGGAKGKASAVFQYMPTVLANEDGSVNYYSALSADDVEISVEKAKTITRYQAWGMPDAAEVSDTTIKSEAGTDGEGKACTLLWPALDKEATSYEWYALYDGEWMLVQSSDTGKLPVSDEDLASFDFRCVYTVDSVRYCTTSLKGVKYVKPEPEVPETAPADIDLNEAPSYETLDLSTGSSVYDGLLFELCFAEGETQKEIHIKAKDDNLAESDEMASFTLLGSVGGAVVGSLDTMLLRVEANDTDLSEPSQIGFDAASASFDKSSGTARINVTRTGGLVKTLSVDWATAAGTAVPGTDYVESSGTVYFAAGQSTASIEIELVNNMTEETAEKNFTVTLSNLRGNGDDSSSISAAECVVGLYNSNTADSLNLASSLYNVDAVDVSADVTETAGAAVASGEITGTKSADADEVGTLASDGGKCTIDWDSDTLDPQLWDYDNGASVSFGGGSWTETNSVTISQSGNGTQSPTYKTTTINQIDKYYTGFSTSIAAHASFRDWTDFWYGNDEIATTRFMFDANGSNTTWTFDPQLHKDGTHMLYYTDGTINASKKWGYNDFSGNSGTFSIGLVTLGNDGKPGANSMSVSSTIKLTRRTIDGGFHIQCFTANDANLSNSDIAKYTSDNYANLISSIDISDGGQKNGKLYEGSSVKITLQSSNLTCTGAGLYASDGSLISTGSVSGNTVSFGTIIANPDSANQYYFRLSFERKQNIVIDLSTSTDPKNTATDKYITALNLMRGRMKNSTITVGYSLAGTYTAGNATTGTPTEKAINVERSNTELSNGTFTINTTDTPNIQWINFNLPEEDVIVVNGKSYPGNSKIWLKRANLTPGNLSFFYYEKDFLTTVRPMTATLDVAAVYYDGNGNGQIDGYFDAADGVFKVDADSGDRFIAYVDGDYSEAQFRPVLDGKGTLHQYFIRQFYTANPVCLVVPSGASATERMQVTPNFITGITDEETYNKLTREQQSYRAVVSGKTSIKAEGASAASTYDYSADNHIKYGAAASAYSYVDIPLGGDVTPCHQMTVRELDSKLTTTDGTVAVGGHDYQIDKGLVYYYDAQTVSHMGKALYSWTADFRGNLLKDFADPEVVYIEHNEVGDNVPVTKDTETWYQKTDGTWTKTVPTETTTTDYKTTADGLYITKQQATTAGAKELNEYLGSFNSNDAYALVVAEQNKTTDDILKTSSLETLDDTTADTKPTISIGTVGVIPDSRYVLNANGNTSSGDGGSDGQGEMEELNLNLRSDITSFSSEGLALFGAETDGLEVTLTIGFPLYGKDNGGGTGSSASNTFDDIKETQEKVNNFIKAIKEKKGKEARNKALAPEEFKSDELKSKSIEFSLELSAAITLKYNPMDNTFMFNKAAIILTAGLEIRLQYRFTFCPLLYVYFQFNVEVTLQSGFTRERKAVYQNGADSIIDNTTVTLKGGNNDADRQYWFVTSYKGFGIQFKGKLYVECHKFWDKNNDGKYEPGEPFDPNIMAGTTPGYITSDGDDITDVILLQQSGMQYTYDNGTPQPFVVVLSYMTPKKPDGTAYTKTEFDALATDKKQTDITGLYRITDIDDSYYWNGFSFGVEVGIEGGAGIGIEIAKAEVYIHIGIEFGFTLGVYDDADNKYGAAQVDTFKLSGAVGVRAVFLFFNYEMELAEYHLEYDPDKDKDGQDVVSNSGWSHGWSALGGKVGGDDKPLGGTSLEDPGDSTLIQIKAPGAVTEEIYRCDVFAEADAAATQAVDSNTTDFQLSEYGASSNAFKLIDGTETGYDYKIVTVGNYNYLVYTASRTGTAGVDKTMLVLSKLIETGNQYGLVNPIAGKATAETNYIPVDNDGTGDLDFTAWAEGNDIHVTWASYASATTVPTKPAAGGAYADTAAQYTFTATTGGSGFTYNNAEITEAEFLAGTASITAVTKVDKPKTEDFYSETVVSGFKKVTVGEGTEAKDWWIISTCGDLAAAQTAYNTANNAYLNYTAYTQAKASFDAWKAYYVGTDAQSQLIAASKNTEVKTAVFNTDGAKATGFSTPVKLDTGANYKFLPVSASDVSAFVRSVPYTDKEITSKLAEYRQFVTDINAAEASGTVKTGGTTGTTSTTDGTEYTKAHAAAEVDYRVAMQRAMYNLYGANSTITVTASDGTTYADGTVYASKHAKDGAGTASNKTEEILASLDMAKIDSTYYLAYVTQQESLIKDTAGTYTDSCTIQRLYLRSFTIADNDDTSANAPKQKLVWSDPYLLRTAVNYESSSSNDGLYNSSLKMTTAYTDPYISGLTFLNGKIGSKLSGTDEAFETYAEDTAEEFLIFEMNGDTYVIKQDSITGITGDKHSGALIPFFTYKQRYGAALDKTSSDSLTSGKDEVVIGADGSGNVAAVYTATVANTSNNAIYISYWDPDLSQWSEGSMLAMNNMSVYEQSVAEGWDNDTTAAAYLNTAKGGDMMQFQFSNLAVALGRGPSGTLGGASLGTQGAEASAPTGEALYGDYLAKLGVNLDSNGELVGLSTYSAADLYALREKLELMGADVGTLNASSPELLVIAQGAKTELEKREVGTSGKYVIAAKSPSSTDNSIVPANLGVYAISYGKGGQQVGNVALQFAYNEFTATSRLYANLSFQNVGDAAIRVNKTGTAVTGPVKVKLMLNHGGVDTVMYSWDIKENIGSGQTVKLATDGACKALTDNLVAGDYFYITVAEDSTAFTTGAYSYNSAASNKAGCSLKYTIADKTDLGVEKLSAAVAGVDDSGNAKIDVRFDVTNRGGAKATDVYAQLSYVSSYDENGEPIYSPLNLTNSELYVSQQRYITGELGTLSVNDDLANGIIYLGTDETFYTRDYYITATEYNAILKQYYSTAAEAGWTSGVYNGTTYYYDAKNYISAYAAYMAGQEAVSGWVKGDDSTYYSSKYASLTDAKNAAEAARKMEYVLTESQYNDLTAAQKVGWKQAGTSYIPASYIPVGYTDLAAAEKAYTAAKADASQDIDKSYCRTVEGAIYAAPALFKGSLTKSLNLRVEVFSSTSNTTLNGAMKVSDHADEYYAQNNAAEQQIEQKTFISAANRITLPLKGIQRLPVSIRTTTGAAPEISVYEVYDGTGTSDGDELGTLYYQADKDTDGVAGTQTGALYITALRSGSGVIHIKDLATNETYPIAYTVADENIGINIFNDNSMFTFYNADGTVFDPDKTGQDWSFDTYLKWPGGSDAPYLDNLAVAKKGAYFTFQTKASKVNLTLENSAALTSNAFIASGMITGTSASHSEATAKIDFSNSTGITHTVKITAASENEPTYFDTLLLEYGKAYTPSDDQNSPGIYFSRSFPVSGSIKDKTAVSLTVYAVDDTGLSALRFNGSAATEVKKTASGLWEYTFEVSQNGSFTIAAEDQNGNQTSRTVTVDWFYTGTTGANTAVTPPALTATIEKHYAGNTKPNEDIYINANVTFTNADSDANNTVVFNATTTGSVGDQITSYKYNKKTGAFETETGISGNGYYMVKAENATNRTFTQQIFYVSIYENLPTVTAVKRANTNVWDWTAAKDEESAAALKSVTLNGVELDSGLATASKSSASGSVTLPYGGAYAFKATDTKDISFTYTVNVTVPVTVAADAVSTAGAWGQPGNTGAQHGRITVDFAKVTGGDYANTGAVTALSQYSGSYEYTVIKTADVKALPGDGSVSPDYAWLDKLTWKQSKGNTTEVTAAAGDKTEYTVLIRDKKNPTDYTTMAVLQLTIADNAIDVTSLSAGIASGEKTADGKIYVVADKGETGYYQFAMLPASASLTAADFKADTVTWHNALWTEANPGFGQFDKVLPGKYQIAVRTFYNGGTESTAVNELFTLGNAIDTAQATLNSLQEARDNAVVSMKIAIDDASRAWQNASADTAAKQAAYDKLKAATPVDNAAANAAYDAWTNAKAAEAAAKAAYETALGAATAAEKQNIIDLRAAWLALGNGDAADKAYAAYTAAVQSLCTTTQQSAYADRITNAKTALASAKTAYDAKDAALAASCKTQYASDSSKWDSMITGTDTQVTVTAGTATALKAIPESSLPTLSTGKVAVTAEGGTAYDGGSVIHYQFAVLRLDDGKKLDFTADMSKIADLGLNWQFADDAKDLPTKHTFTGLSGGTYQVFVREVFDPDSRDGSDINKSIYESGSTDCLYALLTAYQAATAAALPDAVQKLTVSPMSLFAAYETEQTPEKRTAFLDSVGNDAGVAQKLTAWDSAAADKKAAARTELTQAVSAYFTAVKTAERDAAYLAYGTKLAQVKAKAEQAYTQQPGYYDTASYTTVTVGTIALTAIISRTESGNRITFKISNLSNPTLSDAKLILSANADHEVVLEKGDTRIIIPAGMLKSADEVTTIFTNFTAGTGNVVRFTAADGSTEIVPTLIDSGKTSFLYIGRGNYAVTENTVRFRDIAGHWAENSINFTADLTLFNGVGDNRFDPEGTVNRAMVVTVLYRMMGSPSVSGTTPFTDVPSGTWYSDAVLWAYQNGIVDGVTATSYAPMQNMTRQDLVTVICRFLKAYGLLADETGGLDGFKDQSSISAYARDAFSWAVAAGIINGEPGNRLVPTGLATRAQIAAIFERLTHYILG